MSEGEDIGSRSRVGTVFRDGWGDRRMHTG